MLQTRNVKYLTQFTAHWHFYFYINVLIMFTFIKHDITNKHYENQL
jgi:hypothetical protein